MNEIVLTGCRPTPLAGYLKALGIASVLSQQADSESRTWWGEKGFVIDTTLSHDQFVGFLLRSYSPSPILNPWGGRSGFYAGSSEKSAREALDAICGSSKPRLEKYAQAVESVKNLLRERGIDSKPKDKLGSLALLQACRSQLPESLVPWLDAVYVLTRDGRRFPPLLGTGGNEGSGSYTSSYAQSVVELFVDETGPEQLEAALFDVTLPKIRSAKRTPGQFDPGRTGGANQGPGVVGDVRTNPWDIVLTFEGTLLYSGAASRRYESSTWGTAAFPFMVLPTGVGYTSASEADEQQPKAEVWAPLWSRPTGIDEIRALFSEGRASIGRRRAETGLDFTRAISCLGVDRGIDGFERSILLERRGQGYYVAMPAGRLPVRFQPNLRLIDDLDPILGRLDGFIRQFPNVPATFESARRRIDEAIYECCVEPRPDHFGDLVCALGRMERLVAQRDRSKKPALGGPLSGLRPTWIAESDDGEPEVRIAAALSSIRATGKVGPIRANMAGVDAGAPWKWASGHGQRRWRGNNLAERLAGVVEQRLMDAERLNALNAPIEGALHLSPRDLIPFLYGETDDQRLEDLLWGFTLVDWWHESREDVRYRWREPLAGGPLPRGWCALKLVFSPNQVQGRTIRLEPRIVALLKAGRPDEAAGVAHHRLRVSDLKGVSAVERPRPH